MIGFGGRSSPCVFLLGYFDAVHIGHRALIARAKEIASELEIETGALTFTGGKKGARLAFYPRGCRFYRVSRGVQRPIVLEGLTLEEARRIAAEHTGGAAPSYSRGYAVVDPMGRCVCVGVREQSVRGRG